MSFGEPAPAVDPARLIVPGKCVGSAALGMLEREVAKALGKPNRTSRGRGGPVGREVNELKYKYAQLLLNVYFVEKDYMDWEKSKLKRGMVSKSIQTSYSWFTTKDGLGVGTYSHQFFETYGDDFQQVWNERSGNWNVFYRSLGLNFAFTPERIVCNIGVLPAEGG